jgi:hypothetical protein
VLIGHVDERDVSIALPPATATAVPMRLDGTQASSGQGWNEICFRLYSEYNLNNHLVIDIRDGIAEIGIEKVCWLIAHTFFFLLLPSLPS